MYAWFTLLFNIVLISFVQPSDVLTQKSIFFLDSFPI